MKFILLVLFPFFIYAQTSYPDTLFMKQGRNFPCLITEINNSSVSIIYANNIHESAILESVSKIIMEKHAVIYTSEKGMIIDLNIIDSYLKDRNEAEEKRKEALEDQNKQEELANRQKSIRENQDGNSTQNKVKPYLKWSFGIQYVPFYSGKIYTYVRSSEYSSGPLILSTVRNETIMEGQFSYGISPDLRLTFDIGYTATFAENRDETHVRYPNPEQTNNDYGILDSRDLKLFGLTIGVKYYLSGIISEKVSAYILGGFGRQFAFSSTKNESLFPHTEPGSSFQDNMDEHLVDLNSPWHLNFGFGAEYYFNESLSLFSSIRFYYTSVSSKYESRTINNFQTQSNSREYSSSDMNTRIGLGINFYF